MSRSSASSRGSLRRALSRSLSLTSTFFLALVLVLALALPPPTSALTIQPFPRQVQPTSDNATSPSSPSDGGAQSASNAAQAAGNSINTGAGGDRSTPRTQADFARLLSGNFFGCLLCLFFGGAFVVQAWSYFEAYGRKGADRRALQALVGMLLFCSLVSNAVLIHRIFDVHVTNFGNFAFPLLTIGWELTVDYICIAFMATGVQLYFAHRVYSAFGRSLFIAIPFGILISFTFIGGITSGALSLRSGSAANVRGSALQSFRPHSTPWQFSVVFATWLIAMAVTDVGLCVLLVVQLSKMKSPFFNTRHAVARLLTLSIETCFTTVGFSLSAMILFLTIPQNFFYLVPLAPIGQLYAASVTATLLARPSIAKELAAEHVPAKGASSRGVDEYARGAPTSLAKPVLKRIMKKEERRYRRAHLHPLDAAAAGRGVDVGEGVQMVTTVQQVASGDEEGDLGALDLGVPPTPKVGDSPADPRLADDGFLGGLGLGLGRSETQLSEKRPFAPRGTLTSTPFTASGTGTGTGAGTLHETSSRTSLGLPNGPGPDPLPSPGTASAHQAALSLSRAGSSATAASRSRKRTSTLGGGAGAGARGRQGAGPAQTDADSDATLPIEDGYGFEIVSPSPSPSPCYARSQALTKGKSTPPPSPARSSPRATSPTPPPSFPPPQPHTPLPEMPPLIIRKRSRSQSQTTSQHSQACTEPDATYHPPPSLPALTSPAAAPHPYATQPHPPPSWTTPDFSGASARAGPPRSASPSPSTSTSTSASATTRFSRAGVGSGAGQSGAEGYPSVPRSVTPTPTPTGTGTGRTSPLSMSRGGSASPSPSPSPALRPVRIGAVRERMRGGAGAGGEEDWRGGVGVGVGVGASGGGYGGGGGGYGAAF